MKVTSINYVKANDVPKPSKTTELSLVTKEIADALKKAPAGSAVQLQLDSTKRWTGYALKKALAAKHNLTVQLIQRDGVIYVMETTGKAKK